MDMESVCVIHQSDKTANLAVLGGSMSQPRQFVRMRPRSGAEVAAVSESTSRLAELEDTVEQLTTQVETQQRVIEALEQRVDDLEGGSAATGGGDHRDAAVLEHLEAGETYGTGDIARLFRQHTDIRQKETLKSRVKMLLSGEQFPHEGYREYTYRPGRSE